MNDVIHGDCLDCGAVLTSRSPRCPEHNLVWKGEPFDLYHKMVEGGYHRHPANTPRAAVR